MISFTRRGGCHVFVAADAGAGLAVVHAGWDVEASAVVSSLSETTRNTAFPPGRDTSRPRALWTQLPLSPVG